MTKEQISRIVRGNDFSMEITVLMPEYEINATQWTDFDISSCNNVAVNLICTKDQVVIPLDWHIKENTNNVIIADVKGKYLHSGTVYSLEITGLDSEGRAWRYKNKQVFSIVDSTSQAALAPTLMADPLELNATVCLAVKVMPIEVEGPQGVTGLQGQTGPQGEKGQDGTISFDELTPEQQQMLKGEQGVTGLPGQDGAQGETGPQGVTGLPGQDGATGPKGQRGATGAPGTTDYNELINTPQNLSDFNDDLPYAQEIDRISGEVDELEDTVTNVIEGITGLPEKVDILAEASVKANKEVEVILTKTIEDIDNQLDEALTNIDNTLAESEKTQSEANKTTAEALVDLNGRLIDVENAVLLDYGTAAPDNILDIAKEGKKTIYCRWVLVSTGVVWWIPLSGIFGQALKFNFISPVSENYIRSLTYSTTNKRWTQTDILLPGATGPQGVTGLPGENGATGPQGVTGIQGPAGKDGQDGAQGPYPKEVDYSQEYLTFEALEDTTFTITYSNNYHLITSIQYSIDNGSTWQTLSMNESTPLIFAGDTILWKKGAISISPLNNECCIFSSTGKFNAYGNIMSIVYDDFKTRTSLDNYYGFFISTFKNSKIVNASKLILSATNLGIGCYMYMFYGCTSLITAPKLPATTLADHCYSGMFNGCTSLTEAPELPATTLTSSCYNRMFYGCTSLITAPELPATTLTSSCYSDMFNGCTSLTEAPELPATTLTSSCYMYMFNGCTSLTEAPELPATTLVTECYNRMFYGCSNLNYIKCLATDISASNCIKDWVKKVSSTGTFITNDNPPAWTTGINGIPTGWNAYTETEYSYVRHYELPSAPQGVTGIQGPQGETGPTGPQGVTGAAGGGGSPVYEIILDYHLDDRANYQIYNTNGVFKFNLLVKNKLTNEIVYNTYNVNDLATAITYIRNTYNLYPRLYYDGYNGYTEIYINSSHIYRETSTQSYYIKPSDFVNSSGKILVNGVILRVLDNTSNDLLQEYYVNILQPMTTKDLYNDSGYITSTTSGLKIEVVQALPASPDSSTLYIIQ